MFFLLSSVIRSEHSYSPLKMKAGSLEVLLLTSSKGGLAGFLDGLSFNGYIINNYSWEHTMPPGNI